jgi:hypothetical protein
MISKNENMNKPNNDIGIDAAWQRILAISCKNGDSPTLVQNKFHERGVNSRVHRFMSFPRKGLLKKSGNM